MGQSCTSARNDLTMHLECITQLVQSTNTAIKLISQGNTPIINTPLLKIRDNAWLKMENFQTSGSFKFRGAYLMAEENRDKTIVVASTGNFAKACAEAVNPHVQMNHQNSKILKFQTPTPDGDVEKIDDSYEIVPDSRLVIFAPSNANKEKFKKIGSQIIYQGNDCVESEHRARKYANEKNAYYASPYNSPYMIAGAGTLGWELQQQFQQINKSLNYIFISVGGGGLIGGIALYLKYMKSMNVKIIGVQPQVNAAMYHILKKHEKYELKDTVADGTAGGVEDNSITIQICKYLIDDWILIDEQQIIDAQQTILRDHKIIVEGAAAMAYAGWQNYDIQNENSVIILCGSNVDPKQVINQID